MKRMIRHLISGPYVVSQYFPASSRARIEDTIKEIESKHNGEVCFCAEAGLSIGDLFQGTSVRERALKVFSELKVWDTEYNNGVLLYLLIAERKFELVPDRGVRSLITEQQWTDLKKIIEEAFKLKDYEEGVVQALRALGALLEQHFPKTSEDKDELPNAPVFR